MGVIVKRALCLDLPSAGLAIGFLGALGGLWNVIEVLKNIIFFDDKYEKGVKEQSDNETETENSITVFTQLKPLIYVFMFVALIICLLDLISSLLLIRGTKKKSHKLIVPWLIIKGIGLVLGIPAALLFLLGAIYSISTTGDSKLLIDSILMLLILCVSSYLYVIVYSLYHSIRDENLRPPQLDAEALYTNNSNIQYNKT